jgi:selenide,water dikinase
MTEAIRLSQYSRGAGCGCKIAPKILEEILTAGISFTEYQNLLVGNKSRDDAAVFDLGNGSALISTTDFFMPIVDDAFDFGRIAAANSISDVYAMGGKPLMAIAILGWPVEKLPAKLAQQVLEGGRTVCETAGIPLAGGHTIDSVEPFFGLAVSGIVSIEDLKKNNTAKEGDLLFLTKPLGVGILTSAQKKGLLKDEHLSPLIDQLTQLNSIGESLGKIKGLTAMTDVTGFGLLGHLIEMAEGSGLTAELYYDALPLSMGVEEYMAQRIFPDATSRNWNAYSSRVSFDKNVNVMEAFSILPDPQTNGGLLVAIDPNSLEEFFTTMRNTSLSAFTQPIGKFLAPGEKIIHVRNKP